MPEPVPCLSSFFSVSREGEVYIVVLDRKQLSDDDNLEQFSQDLNLLIEKNEVLHLVIHMSNVNYMTSSVIGRLIAVHRRINRLEGRMILAELTSYVAETLSASRLLEYFAVEPDLPSALTALQVK